LRADEVVCGGVGSLWSTGVRDNDLPARTLGLDEPSAVADVDLDLAGGPASALGKQTWNDGTRRQRP
jgi:hypothetical protein